MNIKDRYEESIVNILLKIHQLKKAEKMNRKEIKEIQRKRFKSLLTHTLKHSSFYRDYYKSHGIDTDNIDSIRLEDLPIINKSIVMENFDKIVCDKSLNKKEIEEFINRENASNTKYREKYEIIRSSGSSGKVGIFVYGPNDWSTLKALVISRISKPDIRIFKKSKLAFLGTIDSHYAGYSLKKDVPSFLFDFLPLDINSPLRESVEKLNRFCPDNISGYSSGIYYLALEQLNGNLHISPSRILCSAEPLTENMAETVKKAFKVSSINFYASSESIGMASQCDEVNLGLHLYDDLHIFEVLKENGEAAEEGERGSLLMTNLYNYTQPLIRYSIEDEVVLDREPCPCGRPFPTISRMVGREMDTMWFTKSDGTQSFIHPSVFGNFMIDGLEKFQVVQKSRKDLDFHIVVRGDKNAVIRRVKEKMDKILLKSNLAEIKYGIVIKTDIPNDINTGKFKTIIAIKKMDKET